MTTEPSGMQENTAQNPVTGALQEIQQHGKSFQAFITKCNNDGIMNWAAALAYNLLMAMFPIAIALLAILGMLLGILNIHTENNLIQQISNIFPSVISSQDLIRNILRQLHRDSGLLGIIAIIFAIFSGSRLFILIESCFDRIYCLCPRALVQQNVMATGMLLLFIILIPIMMIASIGPTFVFTILKNTPLGLVGGNGIIFGLGGILGSLISSWILFQAMYMIVPNQYISVRCSMCGSIVAAIALEIYLLLFPLYATHFLGGYVGSVGFTIILLVFFYYFALILLLGAEINAFVTPSMGDDKVDRDTNCV